MQIEKEEKEKERKERQLPRVNSTLNQTIGSKNNNTKIKKSSR